jgi:hypothetical protein
MFKQILEPLNTASTNIFSKISDIYSDVTKYQNSCYYLYETGSSDLSGGFLQAAFQDVQNEMEVANTFYSSNGIVTNFKCVGYQFSNTQTSTGKMYVYFVIQDFASAQVTPILY